MSFHTPSNTGYAIGPQERLFYEVGVEVTGSPESVHFSYNSIASGPPRDLPAGFGNVFDMDPFHGLTSRNRAALRYIRKFPIRLMMGYDAPVWSGIYRPLRRSGIETIISHWGAPLGTLNRGVKLAVKRALNRLNRSGPDLYILQSRGMQLTASEGRGIPESRTCIVPTGVDTDFIRPAPVRRPEELARRFGFPPGRRIVFYSGHMERRKGVHVLVSAAIELVDRRSDEGWHFLIFGNRPGEENRFLEMLAGTRAREHVTFGGYVSNLHEIRPHCFAGAVATTGWDSFPRSTLEMAASGLPVMVSDLLGLRETVVHGETGFTFPVGDASALANHLQRLGRDEALHERLATAARDRIVREFSRVVQKQRLVKILEDRLARGVDQGPAVQRAT